ncbi:hypothetical protein GCM10010359_37130 [Streptomyces morookaense]|nr:hypothetical protein GCM10010359_37130 [Streptomyces morookaense]
MMPQRAGPDGGQRPVLQPDTEADQAEPVMDRSGREVPHPCVMHAQIFVHGFPAPPEGGGAGEAEKARRDHVPLATGR